MWNLDDLDYTKEDGRIMGVIQNVKTGDIWQCNMLYPEGVNRILEARRGPRYGKSPYRLEEVLVDCDNDTLLFRVRMIPQLACAYYGRVKELNWSRFNQTTIKYPVDVERFRMMVRQNPEEEYAPVVVQHYQTNEVLMVAVATCKAIEMTLQTGKVTFWSRTRKRIWVKGETSGNYLELKEAKMAWHAIPILFKVNPVGPVCHTGAQTCFREVDGSMRSFL